MSKEKAAYYLEIYQREHVENGLSYSKIREKYNIPRGTWNYYIRKTLGNSCDLRRKRAVDDFFDVIDSEIKSYLLGFIYGDGYISKDGRIGIMIQEDDIEIINLIKENIAPNSIIRHTNCQIGVKHKRKPQVSIRFKSKRIYERLIEFGFTTNKTFIESNVFSFIPEEFKKDFIRGFCDADGNIRFNKTKEKGVEKNYYKTAFTICKGNKKTLQDIFIYFKEKNINIDSVKERKGSKNIFYSLETNKIFITYQIVKMLYENANFYLKRKYDKAMSIIDYYKDRDIIRINTELTPETKESGAV